MRKEQHSIKKRDKDTSSTQLWLAVAELEQTKQNLDKEVKESTKEAVTSAKLQDGLDSIKNDYTQRLQSFMDKVEESLSRLRKENNPYLVYKEVYPPDNVHPKGSTVVILWSDNAQVGNGNAKVDNVDEPLVRIEHWNKLRKETLTEFADWIQKIVMVGFEDSNEHVWNRPAVDTFRSPSKSSSASCFGCGEIWHFWYNCQKKIGGSSNKESRLTRARIKGKPRRPRVSPVQH